MVDSMKELEEKQHTEREVFVRNCPHTEVDIEDHGTGFRKRDITLRCKRCRLNLLTYCIDGSWSYLSYVRDCVDGHPDSRPLKKEKEAAKKVVDWFMTLAKRVVVSSGQEFEFEPHEALPPRVKGKFDYYKITLSLEALEALEKSLGIRGKQDKKEVAEQ